MLGQPLTHTAVGNKADEVYDRKVAGPKIAGPKEINIFDGSSSTSGLRNGAPPKKKQNVSGQAKPISLGKEHNDDENDDDDDDDDDNDNEDDDDDYDGREYDGPGSRMQQTGKHGPDDDSGPLIASVNAEGTAHARLVGDTGASEDALIGRTVDNVVPKGHVSAIEDDDTPRFATGDGGRGLANGASPVLTVNGTASSGPSANGTASNGFAANGSTVSGTANDSIADESTANSPDTSNLIFSKSAGGNDAAHSLPQIKILDPMVPMEILKTKQPKQRTADSIEPRDRYQAPADGYRSQKPTSKSSSSSEEGSIASSSGGGLGGSTTDSSIPDDHSREQTIPSLAQDARFADLVATAPRARQTSSRAEQTQFPNMLSDMYSQPASLPLFPPGIRENAPNMKESSYVPSVDRFSEIAYPQARVPASPQSNVAAPRFQYNYQNNMLQGYPFAMNSAPNPVQYGSFVYLPSMNGADRPLSSSADVLQRGSHSQGMHDPNHSGDLSGHSLGNPASHHGDPEGDSKSSNHHRYLLHNDSDNDVLHCRTPHQKAVPQPYSLEDREQQRRRNGRVHPAVPFPVSYGTGVPSHYHEGSGPASSAVSMMAPAEAARDQPSSNGRGTANEEPGQSIEERVYRCPEPGCEWSFVRSSDLKRHVRSHKEPSLKCPYWEITPNCNRKGGMFHRLDVLKRHLRLVHLNRPADGGADGGQCQVCLRKFSRTKDFIDHCDTCAHQAHHALGSHSSLNLVAKEAPNPT